MKLLALINLQYAVIALSATTLSDFELIGRDCNVIYILIVFLLILSFLLYFSYLFSFLFSVSDVYCHISDNKEMNC